ncbi:MAG: acyl-[acyl-carrier-protein] thioesterase [Lachnospiraceae bacterium]|jgi:acyl-ACP thioesterase|nr:acyl-[acyl-carrier-protein] thioesterase [Lachnospiraceae bacterium]
MYSFESAIRYSEIDEAGELTLTGLVNYFQDCSTFQSEAIGLGLKWLEKEERAWLLLAWQIEVLRYPKFTENIRTCTWASDFKKVYGSRNFVMETRDKETLAFANSIWVYLDTKEGRPARAPLEVIERYSSEPPYPMEYMPRKIEIPVTDNSEKLDDIPIQKHHLDTNGHVNNSQYVQMALDCADAHKKPKKLRMEYKKSAIFGDVLMPRRFRLNEKLWISLSGADNTNYAIAELVF